MPKQDVKNYQTLRSQLDKVMAELQLPETDIDRAIVLHKQATDLIDKLEKHLAEAQTIISSLTNKQN
jgi:exodeoxyribonuclease VII small subunit